MVPHATQQRFSCLCRLLVVPWAAMSQSVRCLSYRLDKQGFVVRLPAPRNLPFPDESRKITRCNHLVVTGAIFLGSKAANAWSCRPPPSNAEVKNEWNYNSSPLYAFSNNLRSLNFKPTCLSYYNVIFFYLSPSALLITAKHSFLKSLDISFANKY
jgi:hypothetical protein